MRLAGEHLAALRHYPDDVEHPTALLAAAIGVPTDRVVLTNGASEAIALIAAEHPVGWVEAPEFAVFGEHLRFEAGSPRWRSNPNNPLGTLAPAAEVAFVWDETFWPLATGTWTRGDEASWRIASLTKLWSCPGLRLGYAIGPDREAADRLRRRQPRWAVNNLALTMVEPLLALTDLPRWSGIVASLRTDLAELFRAYGYFVRPSVAPWILVEEAADLIEPLARHGVLVRDGAELGLAGTVRVGVPDGTGLMRLAEVLHAVRAGA